MTDGQSRVLYSATIVSNPAHIVASVPATVAHDDTKSGQGVYIVTFTPQYSSPNNYAFTFAADGSTYVPQNLTTIFINPGY